MTKMGLDIDGALPDEPRRHVKLPAFSPDSSQALADRVHALRHARRIKGYSTFAKEAGVRFGNINSDKGYDQRLSRWLNDPYNEYDLLGEVNYAKLATHVIIQNPLMEDQLAVPVMNILQNTLYHAIAPLLNCQDRIDARKTIINNLQGKYIIYRPSMKRLEYGYVGFMEVRFEAESESFTTREIYEIVYEDGSKEYWDIKGAMFPINKNIHMIVSVDQVDNSIQTKFIDTVGFNIDKVTYFAGWISDTDRNIYYTTPIYCRRVDDFDGEKLDFVPIAAMPRAVRTWLDSPQSKLSLRGTHVYTEK